MPWVHKDSLAVRERFMEQQAIQIAALTARVTELTDTILALKRQGFHPPEPTYAPPQIVKASPVDEAIRALPRQHQGNVMREVKRWREGGMSEKDILRRVELGEEAYQESA